MSPTLAAIEPAENVTAKLIRSWWCGRSFEGGMLLAPRYHGWILHWSGGGNVSARMGWFECKNLQCTENQSGRNRRDYCICITQLKKNYVIFNPWILKNKIDLIHSQQRTYMSQCSHYSHYIIGGVGDTASCGEGADCIVCIGLHLTHAANMRHWAIVGSMLGQRRRQWNLTEPTITQNLVFARLRTSHPQNVL